MLAAPMQGRSDAMLSQAIAAATQRGLVEPSQHVVCVESVKDILTLKIISVDNMGRGMSLQNDLPGDVVEAFPGPVVIYAPRTCWHCQMCVSTLVKHGSVPSPSAANAAKRSALACIGVHHPTPLCTFMPANTESGVMPIVHARVRESQSCLCCFYA